MSCTSSRLELLQAVITFAASLRIIRKARDSKLHFEQALTDVIQALRTVKQLLATGSLSGRQRASLEKWVEQSEEELRVLVAAQVSNDSPVPRSEPQLASEMPAQPSLIVELSLGPTGQA